MSFSLIPDYSFRKIQDVTTDFLTKAGISLLLLDVDNTLAPYGTEMPEKAVVDWCDGLKRQGVTPYILSNNRTLRAQIFSDVFGIGYTYKAGKPFPAKIKKVMRKYGKTPRETAIAGDQIFTDVLGANLSGASSLLIQPIRLKNPLHWIRYMLELPFRKKAKEIH